MGLIEEPADLSTQECLEQPASHRLRRGPRDDSRLRRRREMSRCVYTGLSRQCAEEPEFGGKRQGLAGPLFLKAGVNLESVVPVGRKEEMEVYIDQGHPSEDRHRSWVRGGDLPGVYEIRHAAA